MTDRHIPCTECRKQRRKCIQNDPDEPCLRCEKIGKVCINPGTTSTDPNNEVDRLKEQVEKLSLTIKGFEDELKLLQRNENADLQKAMINDLCYQWKVQIQDGYFRIDTGIKNLSDLLSYQPSISYLSPMSMFSSSSSEDSWGEESGIYIRFKTQEYGSLYGLTGKILSNRLLRSSPPMLEHAPFYSRAVMDQLIDVYFSCHNIYLGAIHEKTFRKRRRHVQDPLNDIISLSICCYVCTTPCCHLSFTAQQRRTMSDFLYIKIKNIILDQFDDPTKKLENVMAINLLSQYMHMTLRFLEYDSYITVAYQICLDLKAHYNRIGPQPTIEYALFTRHFSGTYCLRILLDCVTGKNVTQQPIPFPRIESLPDEPEQTRRFMQSQASIVRLYDHPFIDMLFEQIHLIYIGSTCTVSLETLFRVDQVISEHRQTIPDQMNFCKDIFNEKECMKAIDESTDFFTIFTFVQFTIIILGVHASFLQPVALHNVNEELLNLIRQHSKERSQVAIRLSLYGMNRISQLDCLTPCHFKTATADAMFYIIDTTILLCSSSTNNLASEPQKLFLTVFNAIGKLRSIQKSDLPSVKMGYSDIKGFIHSRKVDIDYYLTFPDPWYALMYDLSQCV